MDKKTKISFAVITMIIGFMVAVQFQTVKEPLVRDTRDMWGLRRDLRNAQELHTNLTNEIIKYNSTMQKYKNEQFDSKDNALRDTLNTLKRDAGLTEVTGPGVILVVDQFFNEAGRPVENVSADLLRRLLNELNSYEAEEIAIDGHRIINTTVIREIQNVTKIDAYTIGSLPFEIKIITDDAEKLYNRMKVSEIIDDFFIDNLKLTVSEPQQEITVPAHENIVVKHLEPVKSEKGGNE